MSRQHQKYNNTRVHDAYETDDLPSTPPPQADRFFPTKRGRQARPLLREAFPDEFTTNPATPPSDMPADMSDELDSHDLSLSPAHAARTSIVDNMLLSLDKFAQSDAFGRETS